MIEILSTKMGVTVGRLNLEDTLINLKDGDIESTTSKIEDEDVLLALSLLVETVSNGGSGWLVDDSQNIESCDSSSILGSLSLSIVEIGWASNNCGFDCLTKVLLSNGLHLGQNHGRNLFGLEFLLFSLMLNDYHWSVAFSRLDLEWPELDVCLNGLVFELSSDESLGIEDSVQWVSGSLILGSISDESVILGEGNVRWGGVVSLIVWNDFDLVVLPDSNAGVGGSEIDTDSNVCLSCHLSFKSVFLNLIIMRAEFAYK